MENFQFHVPTNVLFGKGQISHLPKVLAEQGKKVLLVYGGGSIKKNGLYDKVIELLTDNRFVISELSGVEPNPRVETVIKGAAICHQANIDVILAVGGGSTIDCAKAIGAAYYYDGDPWDLVENNQLVTNCLPIITILTMAATGSEMNQGAVITNLATQEKRSLKNWQMIPKASILDPSYTFSVPAIQTAAGAADILSHLIENYFSQMTDADVQDFVAEGLMKAVIKNCPIAITEPENYSARANLMWASSLALNGLTGGGKTNVWSCHPIEHELSAFYDITHGIGLAIITPRWLDYILSDDTVDKIATFTQNVWDIPAETDLFITAKKGIQATYDYFENCNIPMTLPEVGINGDKLALMAEKAVSHSSIATDAYVPLQVSDILAILQASMTTQNFKY